jgi:hypothetical protein
MQLEGIDHVALAVRDVEQSANRYVDVLGFARLHKAMWDSLPSPKRDINAVLTAHDKELLAIPDVVGVYVGTLEDRRTLYLRVRLARKNPETERKIPRSIEGYPVRVEVSGEIRPMSQQP